MDEFERMIMKQNENVDITKCQKLANEFRLSWYARLKCMNEPYTPSEFTNVNLERTKNPQYRITPALLLGEDK